MNLPTYTELLEQHYASMGVNSSVIKTKCLQRLGDVPDGAFKYKNAALIEVLKGTEKNYVCAVFFTSIKKNETAELDHIITLNVHKDLANPKRAFDSIER